MLNLKRINYSLNDQVQVPLELKFIWKSIKKPAIERLRWVLYDLLQYANPSLDLNWVLMDIGSN